MGGVTHDYDPPRGYNVCCCRADKQSKLIPFALIDELLPDLAKALSDKEAGHAFHDNKSRAGPLKDNAPPRCSGFEPWVDALGKGVETDEKKEGVHRHLEDAQRGRAPKEDKRAMGKGMKEKEER